MRPTTARWFSSIIVDWKECDDGHIRIRTPVDPVFAIELTTNDRLRLGGAVGSVQHAFNELLSPMRRIEGLDRCWKHKGPKYNGPEAPPAFKYPIEQKCRGVASHRVFVVSPATTLAFSCQDVHFSYRGKEQFMTEMADRYAVATTAGKSSGSKSATAAAKRIRDQHSKLYDLVDVKRRAMRLESHEGSHWDFAAVLRVPKLGKSTPPSARGNLWRERPNFSTTSWGASPPKQH